MCFGLSLDVLWRETLQDSAGLEGPYIVCRGRGSLCETMSPDRALQQHLHAGIGIMQLRIPLQILSYCL